jgi:hypothetical protein
MARHVACGPARHRPLGRRAHTRRRARLNELELAEMSTGESVVRASARGDAMVLVPAGRMRRGFDRARLARLDAIYGHVWFRAVMDLRPRHERGDPPPDHTPGRGAMQ